MGELFNEEDVEKIVNIYDERTKNTKNSIRTEDWIALTVLANTGDINSMKAIAYAYKLGLKNGRKLNK